MSKRACDHCQKSFVESLLRLWFDWLLCPGCYREVER